jgi:hypothetical protein
MPIWLLLLLGGGTIAAVAAASSSKSSGPDEGGGGSGDMMGPEEPNESVYRRTINEAGNLFDKEGLVAVQKLADGYEARAKAAEDAADKKFVATWKQLKDIALEAAVVIAAAAGLGVLSVAAAALPVFYMTAAAIVSWELAKSLWKWAFNVGKGFSQEWVDASKANVAALITYGVIPAQFSEPYHVSPMGYAKELRRDLNLIEWADKYAPGTRNVFSDIMFSIMYWSPSDPIIMANLTKVAQLGGGLPQGLVVADKVSGRFADAATKMIVECIGLAAAHDKNAPIYLYKKMIQAAYDGFDRTFVEDDTLVAKGVMQYSLKRRELYNGMDFDEATGDKYVSVTPTVPAVIEAYRRACKALYDVVPAPAGATIVPPAHEARPMPTAEDIAARSSGGEILLAPRGTLPAGGAARTEGSAWLPPPR